MDSINENQSKDQENTIVNEELQIVTLKQFRQYKELDIYSDEEAIAIINVFKELALMAHKIIVRNGWFTPI